MKIISFVIPVFRNKGSIVPTYERIIGLMNSVFMEYSSEIVFVDDGSDDGSDQDLDKLRGRDPNVRVITFSRNFGQVAAIIAGLRVATGDACIWMAADIQEPIEKVSEMIREWQKGNDVIVCYRSNRDDGFIANTASRLFYRLMRIGIANMPRGGFDFTLLDRKALDVLNQLDERNRFIQGDILWLGNSVKFIPYQRLKRTIGKSQWKLSKKLKYFIDGLLNTSYWPLRVMSFFGFSIAFTGFIYALVIIYNRVINRTPFSGWAPIMILILLIGGMIMLMLGVIGEYIWRIYDETRKRPLYIIKKDTK